jgi:hypothetical protein
MINPFFFEQIFRDKNQFYNSLTDKIGLMTLISKGIITITIFSFIYGMTMGFWAWNENPIQIIYAGIKLPLLFLTSIMVVLPSYYVINLAIGGRDTFLQLCALFTSSFSVLSTILLTFVPINLFFMITTPRDSDSYIFMVLLNLIVFSLGGVLSIIYIVDGVRFFCKKANNYHSLKDLIPITIALGIFAFIGTQMAWYIRPWFNYDPAFIRQSLSGNFYIAIFKLIFSTPYLGFLFLVISALIVLPVIIWILNIIQTTPIKSTQNGKLLQRNESIN